MKNDDIKLPPLSPDPNHDYWYYTNSSAPQSTIPNPTREIDANRHATNLMSSVSKLLDMYYSEYNLDATITGTDIRLSIHVSKVDVK